jgi:hypothetical protein
MTCYGKHICFLAVYLYEDDNGCENKTSPEVVFGICNSVEEWDNWVELYPVPTAGKLTLKWKGELAFQS